MMNDGARSHDNAQIQSEVALEHIVPRTKTFSVTLADAPDPQSYPAERLELVDAITELSDEIIYDAVSSVIELNKYGLNAPLLFPDAQEWKVSKLRATVDLLDRAKNDAYFGVIPESVHYSVEFLKDFVKAEHSSVLYLHKQQRLFHELGEGLKQSLQQELGPHHLDNIDDEKASKFVTLCDGLAERYEALGKIREKQEAIEYYYVQPISRSKEQYKEDLSPSHVLRILAGLHSTVDRDNDASEPSLQQYPPRDQDDVISKSVTSLVDRINLLYRTNLLSRQSIALSNGAPPSDQEIRYALPTKKQLDLDQDVWVGTKGIAAIVNEMVESPGAKEARLNPGSTIDGRCRVVALIKEMESFVGELRMENEYLKYLDLPIIDSPSVGKVYELRDALSEHTQSFDVLGKTRDTDAYVVRNGSALYELDSQALPAVPRAGTLISLRQEGPNLISEMGRTQELAR